MEKGKKIWVGFWLILLVLAVALGFFLGKKLATKEDNKKEEENKYSNMVDFRNQEDKKENYEYTLENGKYKYTFKGIADKGIEVDGHMIYEGDSIVSAIGVMDNGMIVIDYQGVEVQYGYIRLYFDNNYKQIKRVEGVSFDTGLLAKNYKYSPPAEECVGDYKVIKNYELSIDGNNISDKFVDSTKEKGCAGVV